MGEKYEKLCVMMWSEFMRLALMNTVREVSFYKRRAISLPAK